MQQRYELIRPLVLLQECTARQRAQETDTHPETVGALKRRFEAQGMLGLLRRHSRSFRSAAGGGYLTRSSRNSNDSKDSMTALGTGNWPGSSFIPAPAG